MCGIVGIGRISTGGIWDSHLRTFHDMLIADSVRGMDGTGIVRVRRNFKVELRKLRGNTIDLLRAEGVSKWLGKSVPECDLVVFGHNRYATTKNTTNAHSHPFQSGHITLVHNGTLWDYNSLIEGQKFDVDSDALTHAIAKYGAEEALRKASGPMSIVFYDRKEKTLNFYRNYQRPMFIHYDIHGKEIVFGSEKRMLEWAVDRNNVSGTSFKELEPHLLTRFDLTDGSRLDEIRISPATTIIHSSDPYEGWVGDSCEITQEASEVDTGPAPEPDETPPTTNFPLVPRNHPSYSLRTPISQRVVHVDELFGYRKDSVVQWAAIDAIRTSPTQQQYKIVGCLIDPRDDGSMAKVEVQCFVKEKANADILTDAHYITSKIRSLETHPGKDGQSVIWVSDNTPSMGSDSPEEPTTVTTQPPVKIGPTQSVIVDLKGSKYEVKPTAQPAPEPATGGNLIQLACRAMFGKSDKLH